LRDRGTFHILISTVLPSSSVIFSYFISLAFTIGMIGHNANFCQEEIIITRNAGESPSALVVRVHELKSPTIFDLLSETMFFREFQGLFRCEVQIESF